MRGCRAFERPEHDDVFARLLFEHVKNATIACMRASAELEDLPRASRSGINSGGFVCAVGMHGCHCKVA